MTEDRPARRYLATFGLEDDVPVDDVLAWLAQAVLADGPASGMTIDEVSSALERETGLTVDRTEIQRSLKRSCQGLVSITDHEPPICVINASAREAALSRLSDAQKTERQIVDEWAAQLSADSRAPAGTCTDFVAEDFRYFCGNVALMHGAEIVGLVCGERQQVSDFLQRLDNETWAVIPDRVPGYRDFCRSSFPEFFLEASGPRAVFTANLLDRTLELCRLNIAPNAQRLLAKQLENTALYLDTNVLFCLLGLHGPAAHLDARRVLDLGNRAKVKVRITPRTLQEFRDAALSLQKEHPGRYFPPEALIGLDPRLGDREFFAEYRKLFLRAQVPGGDFCASMNHLERTLEKLGVVVWTEKVYEVEKQGERFRLLTDDLHAQYQAREDRRPPEQRRPVQREKAQHDAFHIILVELLRPPSAKSFADVKTWFATHHYSLAHKAVVRAKGGVPTVIMFEHWHQLLRSVLPRSQEFDGTFVRGMQCRLFRAHRGNYFNAAQTLAARLSAYRDIDDEHFARIITDASFGKKIASIEQTNGKVDDADLTPLIDEHLATELRAETERRKEATDRAKAHAIRAQEAAKEAAAASSQLQDQARQTAAVTLENQELSKQLAQLKDEISRREDAEVSARNRRKRRLSWAVRILAAAVPIAIGVLVFCRYRNGIAVLGMPVGCLTLLIGLAALTCVPILWHRKKWLAAVGIVAGILLAMLQVGGPHTPIIDPSNSVAPGQVR